jgi:hypothetical protein
VLPLELPVLEPLLVPEPLLLEVPLPLVEAPLVLPLVEPLLLLVEPLLLPLPPELPLVLPELALLVDPLLLVLLVDPLLLVLLPPELLESPIVFSTSEPAAWSAAIAPSKALNADPSADVAPSGNEPSRSSASSWMLTPKIASQPRPANTAAPTTTKRRRSTITSRLSAGACRGPIQLVQPGRPKTAR